MELANQKQNIRRKTTGMSLLDALVIFYVAHKLLPIVGQVTPGIAYLAVFAGIAVLFVTAVRNVMTSSSFGLLVFTFSLTLLAIVYRLFTTDFTSVAMYVYGELQIFLYGWIALWYVKRTDPKKIKRLLLIIAVCYLLTAITTLIGCIRYPGASRLLATLGTADAEYVLYTRNNVGSFSFAYEMVLVLPLFVYIVKTKRIKPLWAVAIFALIGITILQMEYTTALMLFCVTLLTLLVKKFTVSKIALFMVLCIIMLALSSTIIASVFDSLGEIIPSDTLSSRFEYIASMLRGEEVDDITSSGDRMALYEKAIDAILDSGFMGTWGEGGESGHSLILDTVAKYGIIGIIALVAMYSAIFRLALYPNRNKDYYPYLLWIYLVAILLAILNPKTNVFIFICVIPLFTAVIDNAKGEN